MKPKLVSDINSRCGYCTGPMKKRLESNDPAYCTYECACNGQPEKAKRTILSSRGTVN